MDASREQLQQDIFAEVQAAATASRRFAIRNYFFAYFVSGVIVLASISAGLTVGWDGVPKWLTASLASLPAVMLTASTVFRFEQKSAWFWKKTRALEGLVRQLKYESFDPVEASRSFSQIEAQMEQEWVSFGTIGKSGG